MLGLAEKIGKDCKVLQRTYFGDNLSILQSMALESMNLIYVDPPFNTGRTQARTQLRTERLSNGERVGFQGQRYKSTIIDKKSFYDKFDDYLAFLEPRLQEGYRLLSYILNYLSKSIPICRNASLILSSYSCSEI